MGGNKLHLWPYGCRSNCVSVFSATEISLKRGKGKKEERINCYKK
jgi:hypothetical protein